MVLCDDKLGNCNHQVAELLDTALEHGACLTAGQEGQDKWTHIVISLLDIGADRTLAARDKVWGDCVEIIDTVCRSRMCVLPRLPGEWSLDSAGQADFVRQESIINTVIEKTLVDL